MIFQLYTDGACSNNGQTGAVGGWAYVIVDQDNNIVASNRGRAVDTTNQRMELTALLEGLRAASKIIDTFPFVQVFSDSAYCINAINDKWIEKWRENGWQTSAKTDVKNQELWRELYPLSKDVRFQFIKIKGHANNHWGDYVDMLAVKAKDDAYTF